MNWFLGIDTSNYTTSVALCPQEGECLGRRRLLPVPPGEKGLRQSQALFAHTKALPALIDSLRPAWAGGRLQAVGVSAYPRTAADSYMPCFLAGVSVAASTAAFFNVPLYVFSHQQGHLAAARQGSGMPPEKTYLAFHLSGGTLELLQVQGEQIQPLCVAGDITLGQLIDRCGVKLGLGFPCGPALEELALKSSRSYTVNIPCRQGRVNLSGLENRWEALRQEGAPPEDLAKFVFDCVCQCVATMLAQAPALPVLFMGGVASSALLRQALAGPDRYFSPASHSQDNALGTALLAREAFGQGLPDQTPLLVARGLMEKL